MKVNRIAAAAAALIMSVSALAVPASAEWVTQGKSVMYTDSDGDYLTGWQKIDGKKYYFSSKGVLRTGWVKFTGGKKYYITKDKGCLTGFKKIGGNSAKNFIIVFQTAYLIVFNQRVTTFFS